MFRSIMKAAESLERNMETAFGSLTEDNWTGREFTISGTPVKLGKVFAQGGYSMVHAARPVGSSYTSTKRYAVKRMSVADKESMAMARAEISTLSSLPPHKNIVHFHGALIVAPAALLMFELVDGGTLQEVLERRRVNRRPLDALEVLEIFYQIVAAVVHLHAQSPPVACRDVKLENVLHDRLTSAYKLIDLGSCTTNACRFVSRREILIAEEDISSNCSMMYRSPEQVDLYAKNFICEKVDVWALGCIFFALMYGKLPFDGASSIPILRGSYTVPDNAPKFPPSFSTLLAAMLQTDPAKRADSFTVFEALCRLRNIEMDPALYARGRQLREVRGRDFAAAAVAASPSVSSSAAASPGFQSRADQIPKQVPDFFNSVSKERTAAQSRGKPPTSMSVVPKLSPQAFLKAPAFFSSAALTPVPMSAPVRPKVATATQPKPGNSMHVANNENFAQDDDDDDWADFASAFSSATTRPPAQMTAASMVPPRSAPVFATMREKNPSIASLYANNGVQLDSTGSASPWSAEPAPSPAPQPNVIPESLFSNNAAHLGSTGSASPWSTKPAPSPAPQPNVIPDSLFSNNAAHLGSTGSASPWSADPAPGSAAQPYAVPEPKTNPTNVASPALTAKKDSPNITFGISFSTKPIDLSSFTEGCTEAQSTRQGQSDTIRKQEPKKEPEVDEFAELGDLIKGFGHMKS